MRFRGGAGAAVVSAELAVPFGLGTVVVQFAAVVAVVLVVPFLTHRKVRECGERGGEDFTTQPNSRHAKFVTLSF